MKNILTLHVKGDIIHVESNKNGGDTMIDLKKLADAQVVADSLSGLPKEALIYIAGYAEGWRDRPKRKRKKKFPGQSNGNRDAV